MKYWRHSNFVQERINISANAQVTRPIYVLKYQGPVIIMRLAYHQRVYINMHFFLFSSTMILQINNNCSHILATYYVACHMLNGTHKYY